MIIRIKYHNYGYDGNIDKYLSMYFNPDNVAFTITPEVIVFEHPIVNGQDILPVPQIDALTFFDDANAELFKEMKKDMGR